MLVLALVLIFGTIQVMAGIYKPGTYKASAMGRKSKEHSGLVEVQVTVDASKIKDIKVTTYEQSLDHKRYGPLALEAKEKVPAAIIEKQSVDVDTVAKATISSRAIQYAVAKALYEASLKKYKPGTYKASAMGRKSKEHSGLVEVEVTVDASKIKDIKVTTYEQSLDHKRYGPLALEAKEKVPAAVIEKQAIDVDSVAKATVSSRALQIAIARALEQARCE
jgi:uncharacterized protein with FMN-binding domain